MNAGAAEPVGHVATLPALVALHALVHRRYAVAPAKGGMQGGRAPGCLSRGMEYAESRPYRAGDDVRSIDWRQTARRGSPFTKLFREEHERPVHLLVDLGASMRFGTRVAFKSVVAARVAALLAWQTVENGDRVGGIVYGNGHREIRPQGRHHGALAMLRQLAEASAAQPDPASSLATTLPALARTICPGAMAILVSDFHALDDAAANAIAALAQRNDVALVQVSDGFESTPPEGIFRMSDGERSVTLDLRSESSRSIWLAPFTVRRARLEQLARHPRVRLLALSTDEDPARVLRLLSGTP